MTFHSDSGTYTCDRNGLLLSFSPTLENEPPYMSFPLIRHLHIPEGVRRIGHDQPQPGESQRCPFQRMIIMGDVTFPASLVALGYSVFSGSVINRMTIPPTLRRMSHGTLMSCFIHTLTIQPCDIMIDYAGGSPIPPGTLSIGGRDFKQTTIEELVVRTTARSIPEHWQHCLMPEARIMKTTIVPL